MRSWQCGMHLIPWQESSVLGSMWSTWGVQSLLTGQFALLPDTPHADDQHVRRSMQFCKRDTAEVEFCGLAAEVCKGGVFMRMGYNWTGLWQQDKDIALLGSYLGKKICVCMCYCGKHEMWRNRSLSREWCLPIYISTKDSSVQFCTTTFQTGCGTKESSVHQNILEAPLPPRAVLPVGRKANLNLQEGKHTDPQQALRACVVAELTIPLARGCAGQTQQVWCILSMWDSHVSPDWQGLCSGHLPMISSSLVWPFSGGCSQTCSVGSANSISEHDEHCVYFLMICPCPCWWEAVGCVLAAILTVAAVWLPTSGVELRDAAGLLDQPCWQVVFSPIHPGHCIATLDLVLIRIRGFLEEARECVTEYDAKLAKLFLLFVQCEKYQINLWIE